MIHEATKIVDTTAFQTALNHAIAMEDTELRFEFGEGDFQQLVVMPQEYDMSFYVDGVGTVILIGAGMDTSIAHYGKGDLHVHGMGTSVHRGEGTLYVWGGGDAHHLGKGRIFHYGAGDAFCGSESWAHHHGCGNIVRADPDTCSHFGVGKTYDASSVME